MTEKDIDYLINKQSTSIKKTSPQLENLEVRYEQKTNGLFSTKVKAKIKQKTVHLSSKDFCIESSLKKLFRKLNRVLQRKKYRASKKFHLTFEEVA